VGDAPSLVENTKNLNCYLFCSVYGLSTGHTSGGGIRYRCLYQLLYLPSKRSETGGYTGPLYLWVTPKLNTELPV